jgi:hypothetical protein
MRLSELRPDFVELIPEQLEDGVLYISMYYATAMHLCACGCGEKAITPLTPSDWRLAFDGETVTLWPSIGNWSFACRSHYVIKKNKIRWAEDWSKSKVKANRAQQRRDKQFYFQKPPIIEPNSVEKEKPAKPSLLRRIGTKLGLFQ